MLQIGQITLFSPVCFLPWRAACPDVVNVAPQPCDAPYGHGYLFFLAGLPDGAVVVVVVVAASASAAVPVESPYDGD